MISDCLLASPVNFLVGNWQKVLQIFIPPSDSYQLSHSLCLWEASMEKVSGEAGRKLQVQHDSYPLGEGMSICAVMQHGSGARGAWRGRAGWEGYTGKCENVMLLERMHGGVRIAKYVRNGRQGCNMSSERCEGVMLGSLYGVWYRWMMHVMHKKGCRPAWVRKNGWEVCEMPPACGESTGIWHRLRSRHGISGWHGVTEWLVGSYVWMGKTYLSNLMPLLLASGFTVREHWKWQRCDHGWLQQCGTLKQ